MKVTGTIYGPHGFSTALELTPIGARAVAEDARLETKHRMWDALKARFPAHSIEVTGMRVDGAWRVMGTASREPGKGGPS